MNIFQKLIFFVGMLAILGSIIYVPYRVTQGYDFWENEIHTIQYQWIELHSMYSTLLNENISYNVYKIKKEDRKLQFSIIAAEIVLFGGLIILTKSRNKKEV